MDILDFRYECRNALDFCKEIPDGSVKLLITSPPYNIGKEYETKISIEEYIKNIEPMLEEFVRILSDDGSLCWQTGNFVDNGEIYPLDIYFYPYFKTVQARICHFFINYYLGNNFVLSHWHRASHYFKYKITWILC